MRLLDEAAPLARDNDVAVEIANLRGHVALARGDAMDARAVFVAPRSGRAPIGRRAALLWAEAATRRSAPGAGGADARGRPRRLRGAAARTTTASRPAPPTSRSGMALVLCGRRRRGPARHPRRGRDGGVRAAVSRARRSAGAGRSRRRSSCARRAPRASRSGGRSPRRAIAASRARSAPLLYLLARDAATTDRWPEARASYYEAAELAHHTGQPGEECAALSGLAWLEAREGREESCRAHARRGARAGTRVRSRHLRDVGARGARRPRARARTAGGGGRAPRPT